MKTTATRPPHVVVLGAGFGGLVFAQGFPSHMARVTVVDADGRSDTSQIRFKKMR